jgi:subtilisin family serine protease
LQPTGTVARAAAQGGGHSDAPSRAGELLVRFGAGLTEGGKDDIASSKGTRRKGKLRGESGVERLELQPGEELTAVIQRLRRQPGVEFAEPNFLVGHDQVTPTDTRFTEQWALRNSGQNGGAPESDVRAPAAWQETVGSYSTVIAVVDSGIDFAHADLAASRWLNPGEVADNGLDDNRDGYKDDVSGWDWVANSGVVRDEAGHGTAVAGLIAAEGNNGRGISGVMWHASLMSLRVLDAGGTGDVAAAVEAIDYAVAHGASVINCSWGTDADSQFLREAIERAGRKGVVVVASAGNSGRDIDAQPYYPASYDLQNLITAASSDSFDNLASFSNRGATRVAVAAPGVDNPDDAVGRRLRLRERYVGLRAAGRRGRGPHQDGEAERHGCGGANRHSRRRAPR